MTKVLLDPLIKFLNYGLEVLTDTHFSLVDSVLRGFFGEHFIVASDDFHMLFKGVGEVRVVASELLDVSLHVGPQIRHFFLRGQHLQEFLDLCEFKFLYFFTDLRL